MAKQKEDRPDPNWFRLESVENRINAAVTGLLTIEAYNEQQKQLRQQCMEELTEIQDGSLLALRRVLE